MQRDFSLVLVLRLEWLTWRTLSGLCAQASVVADCSYGFCSDASLLSALRKHTCCGSSRKGLGFLSRTHVCRFLGTWFAANLTSAQTIAGSHWRGCEWRRRRPSAMSHDLMRFDRNIGVVRRQNVTGKQVGREPQWQVKAGGRGGCPKHLKEPGPRKTSKLIVWFFSMKMLRSVLWQNCSILSQPLGTCAPLSPFHRTTAGLPCLGWSGRRTDWCCGLLVVFPLEKCHRCEDWESHTRVAAHTISWSIYVFGLGMWFQFSDIGPNVQVWMLWHFLSMTICVLAFFGVIGFAFIKECRLQCFVQVSAHEETQCVESMRCDAWRGNAAH